MQRQVREDPLHGIVGNDDLLDFRTREDFFHGFQVKTLLGDILGLAVFLEHEQEPVAVALGLQNLRLFVGQCLVGDGSGLAAGPRDEVVLVGFGLVDEAALVLFCAGHVLEGIHDLLRRMHVLELHRHNAYAALVAVQDSL